MGAIKKTLATVAATGMMLTGGVVAAGPAAAAAPAIETEEVTAQAYPWLDRSHMTSTTSQQTPRNLPYGSASVQVRTGIHSDGSRYGWARALNANTNHILRFEIDTDGDRVWDLAATKNIDGNTQWTNGYATSSSSNRAFRACVMRSISGCGTASQVVAVTDWW
ncbi:hypothetical protein [Nocardiopsis tropica]|uniref:Secreted protein n=1 Tax=Nocardiopsis tropica TaxID=109330 RepID=A0ABU7KKF9_9ACTN|nr:hypothetical protein [Nocardiopsis umidischolae]MEE2049774.1 hypothetical protein [Nocardiopsis umidischolae]